MEVRILFSKRETFPLSSQRNHCTLNLFAFCVFLSPLNALRSYAALAVIIGNRSTLFNAEESKRGQAQPSCSPSKSDISVFLALCEMNPCKEREGESYGACLSFPLPPCVSSSVHFYNPTGAPRMLVNSNACVLRSIKQEEKKKEKQTHTHTTTTTTTATRTHAH